jgi:hypothetical protein
MHATRRTHRTKRTLLAGDLQRGPRWPRPAAAAGSARRATCSIAPASRPQWMQPTTNLPLGPLGAAFGVRHKSHLQVELDEARRALSASHEAVAAAGSAQQEAEAKRQAEAERLKEARPRPRPRCFCCCFGLLFRFVVSVYCFGLLFRLLFRFAPVFSRLSRLLRSSRQSHV